MEHTFSLRQMAHKIVGTTDEAAIESAFQVLRGWSNRDVIRGERQGTGRTSPMGYTLAEVCRAAILFTLRRSLGIEGEALLIMGERITNYRRVSEGPGPVEANFRVTFPRLVKAVAAGEEWFLRVAIIRDRKTGEIKHYLQYGPPRALRAADYSTDPQFALMGVLDLHMSEVLRPVMGTANA